jgi:hypothetical protein
MEYIRRELSVKNRTRIDDFTEKAKLSDVHEKISNCRSVASNENIVNVLLAVERMNMYFCESYLNGVLIDDDDDDEVIVYNENKRILDKSIYDLARLYHDQKGELDLSEEIKGRLRTLGVVVE